MFEINSYMIQKMGWFEYSPTRGLYHNRWTSNKKKSYNLFDSDEYVRYFMEFENKNDFFVIKELTKEEKQKSKNRYKFIRVTQTNDDIKFNKHINSKLYNDQDVLSKISDCILCR